MPERFPRPPIPNSYWVRPGRLLAGEYPGIPARDSTPERIQGLLRAGVNTFIDLTGEGELDPYAPLLPTDGSVMHERWSIVDHDLPQSPEYLRRILDAIDAAIGQGRCVYVHCRAGIGRTGTIVGCHLIRGGLEPAAAIDRLNELWRQCARSASWPSIPETDEQYRYVMEWRETAALPDLSQRCEGALVGLVCGEGLGALRAAGHDLRQLARITELPAAGFDAATTLCAVQSLRERAGHDPRDQMERYLEWSRAAPAADIPADFRRALAAWQWSKKPNAGSHDPRNLGAHTLARSAAAALHSYRNAGAALELAADLSRTTQQSPIVLDMCRLWAAILVDAFGGAGKNELIELRDTPAIRLLRERRLKPEVGALLDGGWRSVVTTDGDVLSVCIGALRAVGAANDFADALHAGLNRAGPATPRAGALIGTLAGACFGIGSIPQRWRDAAPQSRALHALARTFA